MPSSDGSDQKQARNQNPISTHPPPKVTESLPCPRCDSTTTKFCYYNNYNLSQPRHFCKACRRYWTHGGTLRNIPVGGGTRKNSKRTRNSSSSTSSSAAGGGGGCAATTNSSTCSSTLTHENVTVTGANPASVLPCVNPGLVSVMTTDHVNLNEGFPASGSFTNMLSMQVQGQNFLGLDGYHGYGMGSGIEELELGFGGTRGWEIPGGAGYGGGVGATAASGCNTWQMMNVDEGGNGAGLVGEEDCLGWPGLAISTPGGKGLK